MAQERESIYPCPVCGFLIFDEPPGSYDICPICFWEDDIVQLAFPLMSGGANTLSLAESQKGFMSAGVSDARFHNNVRPPRTGDECDPEWRPLDVNHDLFLRWDVRADHDRWKAAPEDACLYWWRKEYWLAGPPESLPSDGSA